MPLLKYIANNSLVTFAKLLPVVLILSLFIVVYRFFYPEFKKYDYDKFVYHELNNKKYATFVAGNKKDALKLLEYYNKLESYQNTDSSFNFPYSSESYWILDTDKRVFVIDTLDSIAKVVYEVYVTIGTDRYENQKAFVPLINIHKE